MQFELRPQRPPLSRLRLLLLLLVLLVAAVVLQHFWATLNRVPEDMVRIPAGIFQAGGQDSPLLSLMRQYSSAGLDFDLIVEPPSEPGYIEQRYFIDRHEVTHADYGTFLDEINRMGANRHRRLHPDESDGKDHTPDHWQKDGFNQPDQPVVGTDWWDADAYCRWAGKRLPSADEWERAARGGGDADRLYPWGDDFSMEKANTGEGPLPGPVKGGRFQTDRSPSGVYDLGGNVMEWTSTEISLGQRDGRGVEGSSWKNPGLFYSLVFLRRAATLNYRSNDVGFRCVRAGEEGARPPDGMIAIAAGGFRKGPPKLFALDLARQLSLSRDGVNLVLGPPPAAAELGEFYLDRFEVTNQNYGLFLEEAEEGTKNPDSGESKSEGHRPSAWDDSDFNSPDLPVVGVDWYDASAYCRWAGKRLPAADEWERAARGEDGRFYLWGQEFEAGHCNSAESPDRSRKTVAVGSLPRCVSPEGVYDLTGNADEWTADKVEDQDGESRVACGGAWSDRGEVRGLGYVRLPVSPGYRREDMGFRCASDPRRSWVEKALGLLAPDQGPGSTGSD